MEIPESPLRLWKLFLALQLEHCLELPQLHRRRPRSHKASALAVRGPVHQPALQRSQQLVRLRPPLQVLPERGLALAKLPLWRQQALQDLVQRPQHGWKGLPAQPYQSHAAEGWRLVMEIPESPLRLWKLFLALQLEHCLELPQLHRRRPRSHKASALAVRGPVHQPALQRSQQLVRLRPPRLWPFHVRLLSGHLLECPRLPAQLHNLQMAENWKLRVEFPQSL